MANDDQRKGKKQTVVEVVVVEHGCLGQARVLPSLIPIHNERERARFARARASTSWAVGRKLRGHTHRPCRVHPVTQERLKSRENLSTMPPFVLAIKGTRRDNNSQSMFPVGGWYRRSASVVRVRTWNYVYLAFSCRVRGRDELPVMKSLAPLRLFPFSLPLLLYRQRISILYIAETKFSFFSDWWREVVGSRDDKVGTIFGDIVILSCSFFTFSFSFLHFSVNFLLLSLTICM